MKDSVINISNLLIKNPPRLVTLHLLDLIAIITRFLIFNQNLNQREKNFENLKNKVC